MTAVILRWPKHFITTYESLGGCQVCEAWEGEVPTDCPGVKMTEEQRFAVLEGELDYRRSEGGWTAFTRSKWIRNRLMCE